MELKNFYLGVFYLLFSKSLFSQYSFVLPDQLTKVMALGDSIFVFQDDSLRIFDAENLKNIDNRKLIYQGENIGKVNDYYPLVLPKGVFFVHQQGGLVLHFDGKRTLKRIDQSFNHKMWVSSTIFNRGNTIYRFGGYGLWSTRDFISYYDWESKEWEAIFASESEENPPGTISSLVYQEGPYAYFICGIGFTYDLVEKPYLINKIYRFNFDNLEWKEFSVDIEYSETDLTDLKAYDGDQILFLETEKKIIDFKQNKISYFRGNSVSFSLARTVMPALISLGDDFIIFKRKPPYLIIEKVKKTAFFGETIKEVPLFKKTLNPLIHLLWIFLLFPIFGFIKRRNKNQNFHLPDVLKVEGETVIYGGKRIEISDKESAILELLLKQEEVDSGIILDIVENPEHNYSHNIRVRNQVMEDLNFRLKTILNSKKDLISNYKSKTDKRFKVYKLEKNIKRHL